MSLVLGCAGSGEDPEPAAPPWVEAEEAEPAGVQVVAPRLEPPPARDDALDRDGALRLTRAHQDPSDAIAELDARPFDFTLDEAAIEWFGGQGCDPQVLDYLRKRAAVDWEALRGDVDPDGPQ